MNQQVSAIQLVGFDIDGVLTDGSIIVDDHGVESKRFHVRDGFAIQAALEMGLKVAALSGRCSRAGTMRLTELGVDPLLQGVHDKSVGLDTICQRAGVLPEQCAYVGDDLLDLAPMVRSGYAIAVADAVEEVKAEAHYVTKVPGGHGAARDAIEHILKSQDRWDELVDRYGI